MTTAGEVVSSPRRRTVIVLCLWALAAVAAIAVLVVAIVGRDHGDRPTLRAMAAGESMSDDQARAIADNTVRVWVRERNAGHLANLLALSCPPETWHGTVALEIDDVKQHKPVEPMEIRATGAMNRNAQTWMLNTHFQRASVMFVMKILDGELRVCEITAAPVP